MGYSPWGRKVSDTAVTDTFTFFPASIHLFNKYSVSAKNAPGTVRGTRRQNTEQIAHQIDSAGLLSFIALCQENC